jgi:hypothetical protein
MEDQDTFIPTWLRSENLLQYADIFKDNEVFTKEALLALRPRDLESMLRNKEAVTKIQEAIEKLASKDKDPNDWDEEEVYKWVLEVTSKEEYAKIFKEKKVTGKGLLKISGNLLESVSDSRRVRCLERVES